MTPETLKKAIQIQSHIDTLLVNIININALNTSKATIQLTNDHTNSTVILKINGLTNLNRAMNNSDFIERTYIEFLDKIKAEMQLHIKILENELKRL